MTKRNLRLLTAKRNPRKCLPYNERIEDSSLHKSLVRYRAGPKSRKKFLIIRGKKTEDKMCEKLKDDNLKHTPKGKDEMEFKVTGVALQQTSKYLYLSLPTHLHPILFHFVS